MLGVVREKGNEGTRHRESRTPTWTNCLPSSTKAVTGSETLQARPLALGCPSGLRRRVYRRAMAALMVHATSTLESDVLAETRPVLAATRPAWERAYEREPATAGDKAVSRLVAMFERAGVDA